jgi:acyl carrier protein
MKKQSLWLAILTAFFLAACGGNDATPELPTPTLAPTLTTEERLQFPAGQAENPLLMAIRPVDTVGQRLRVALAQDLAVRISSITTDANLREDLGADQSLSVIASSLLRDFDVELSASDAESIQTVSDIIQYVQNQLGERVSDSLFETTGLYVNLVFVDRYAQAFADLCASGSGLVTIPWLDGLTYTAALAQGCGQPALLVAKNEIAMEDFEALDFVEPEIEETPESTSEVTPETTAEATGEANGDDVTEVAPTETPDASPTPDENLTPAPEITAIPDPDTGELRLGEATVLITNRRLGSGDIFLAQGRVFCRLGEDDFYSWFVPALLMERANLDPVRSPIRIDDYPDTESLVQAVMDGDCDISGIAQTTYDALEDTSDLRIVDTTIRFPFGILMYPLEVELGVRLSLNDSLMSLADDPIADRSLHLLLGQDMLIPVEEDSLAPLTAFMQTTGYDFAQLGN